MAGKYSVYIHTSPSGKRYVGITKQEVNRRWRGGLGYRRNEHFFAAIVKYGWDNFKHEIYAENLSQENAEEIEQFLIMKFNSKDRRYGYNHTDGGDGTKGCVPNEETRRKMSAAHSGNKNHLYGKHLAETTKLKISNARVQLYKSTDLATKMREASKNKKPVFQYTLQGKLIREWNSRRQAENEFNPGKKSYAIGKCCNGDCTHAYGYIWSYEQKAKQIIPIWDRKVYQRDLTGSLIKIWDNLENAVLQFRENKKSTVIKQCVTGHTKTAYGYIWAYSPQSEVG